MSSFFDESSLVFIPSGYKTSKAYSVKPTDGTGDLTFTRSNDTATRVGPDGLIEKVRTNSILQSEAFNTTWSVVTMSVTANTTANPLNGGLTADTITLGAGTIQKYIEQGIVLSGNFTASVYLKAGTQQFIQFLLGTDATPFANFDLVNGTASATGSTATIVSAGSGWYRCSMSFTSTIGTNVIMLGIDSLGATRFLPTASTGNFITFGYQLETGDIATPYIPTTTAAVSVGPVANVPRLDYLNSSCPRLLLEPQRTNTLLLSEQLDVVATWSRGNVSVTANNAVSPDGYTNADLITADGTTTQHYVLQGQSGAARTYSIFLKMGTQRYVQILTSGTAAPVANYDLQNGVANMVGSSSTASIENYGNGWYRCILSTTDAAAASFYLLFASSMTSGRFEANNSSGTIWAYGAQAEAGAYATSYIPTLGASVTRGADAASKTGISSLIGQTEGTLYAEFTRLNVGNAVVLFQCNDGTTNNRAQLEIGTSGIATGVVLSGGAVSCVITGATLALGQTHKLALTYKANDFKLYVNGVLAGTDTSGAVPISMSRIDLASELGTSYGGVSVSQILNFTTALTNAQAIELTA